MHRTNSALPVTMAGISTAHLLRKFEITNIMQLWIMTIKENEVHMITCSIMIACT
jgi:hypothetical protein